MSFIQRPRQVLIAAGFLAALASPAQAGEASSSWRVESSATAGAQRLAMLPALPRAPRQYAMTPERRALLNTIRWAEGTWANGREVGYRIMFGGSLMRSLDRHPNQVNRTARYASAAAGAYQFMPFTWAMATRAMGLSGSMHPEAQDQAALFLIQRRGALHLADRGQLTPELASKLAPEWASFPTLAGASYYGQPVKRFDDLRQFYEWNLAQLRREEQVRWEPVAIQPVKPPCNDSTLSCRLERVAESAD